MGKVKLWAILIALVFAIGGAAYGWWWFDGRWRPKTIDKHQAEISTLLEKAGWASNGAKGPKLYMIGYRSCPDCVTYWQEELPKLKDAGVDTRVIMIARRDLNGVAKSSPVERSTVAELWVNRDWGLLQRWFSVPLPAWTAPAIPPSDDDTARAAVIEAGRKLVDDLRPLLAANGVEVNEEGIRYPTLVWWTAEGEMKACVCEQPESYSRVRKDLIRKK